MNRSIDSETDRGHQKPQQQTWRQHSELWMNSSVFILDSIGEK